MHEKTLTLLRMKQGFVSGEEISRALTISRSAIWKHVQDLRRIGYKIQGSTHKGYCLISVPDKLLPWEIQKGLRTRKVGRQIHSFEEIGSTMDEALSFGLKGFEEGLVVCAERQITGRGRRGRSWLSPAEGGLYFSILLRPLFHPKEAAKLTLMTAVVVCETIRDFCGIDAKIKWPNDILVAGRKVAGVLTELNSEIDRIKFLVIGIGINVNTDIEDLPDEATSLKREARRSILRVALLCEFLNAFEQNYWEACRSGFGVVLERWTELSATIGQNVRFQDSGAIIVGRAVALDEDGGLLIITEEGDIIKRLSGDILNS